MRKEEADRDYGICLGLWSSTTRGSRGSEREEGADCQFKSVNPYILLKRRQFEQLK